MSGRGGHWNRAGRRSGGARPVRLDVGSAKGPRGGVLLPCPRCDGKPPQRDPWQQCETCGGTGVIELVPDSVAAVEKKSETGRDAAKGE